MDNKMTAEQAIKWLCETLGCDENMKVIAALRQALTAPRVLDELRSVVADIRAHCNPPNPETCDDVTPIYALSWADRIEALITAATAPADPDFIEIPEFIEIPDSLRRLSNFEEHGQRVIDALRERVKELEGYNVGLANESHALQERVKALEEQQIASMALARRMFRGIKTKPNWWLFSQLFGTGRTAAVQRCESLGIDPEAASLRGGSDE
jgi:hypothetical protein